MIEYINEIQQYIKQMYALWRQSIRMRLAISLADMKQRAFNRRYFIMTMQVGKAEKLVSVSRQDIVRLKRKRWLPRTFTYLQLEQECWYMTGLERNNKVTKEEREKALKRYRKYLKQSK